MVGRFARKTFLPSNIGLSLSTTVVVTGPFSAKVRPTVPPLAQAFVSQNNAFSIVNAVFPGREWSLHLNMHKKKRDLPCGQ
jgi:hypothetical protein